MRGVNWGGGVACQAAGGRKLAGGWQQEGIVEGGRILGRRSSLVGSLRDCSWQGGWKQDGDVEGRRGLVRTSSLASCWKA